MPYARNLTEKFVYYIGSLFRSRMTRGKIKRWYSISACKVWFQFFSETATFSSHPGTMMNLLIAQNLFLSQPWNLNPISSIFTFLNMTWIMITFKTEVHQFVKDPHINICDTCSACTRVPTWFLPTFQSDSECAISSSISYKI